MLPLLLIPCNQAEGNPFSPSLFNPSPLPQTLPPQFLPLTFAHCMMYRITRVLATPFLATAKINPVTAASRRTLTLSTARIQQPGQFFLLLVVNRLTLLADATDREGDSSFTLSSKVFFMAAGEIFSWSAKCCSSLQWGSGRGRHRKKKMGRVGGKFCKLFRTS